MKFRGLQLIIPILVVAGGGAAANVLVLSQKAKDAIYSDWNDVKGLDDFNEFMTSLENNKAHIAEDYYNEFKEASSHIKNIIKAATKSAASLMRDAYLPEYEYFNSNEFKYIDKKDIFNRFINPYAYLEDTHNLVIYSDEGYSLQYLYREPDAYSNSVVITLKAPINQANVPETTQYTFNTIYTSRYQSRDNNNSSVKARDFLTPIGKNKRSLEIHFAAPYVFEVETKVGTYTFDYRKMATDYALSCFKTINNENKNNVFDQFEQFTNALDPELVQTYKRIKDPLSKILACTIVDSSVVGSSIILTYKQNLPSLIGKSEPFLTDEEIYNFCIVSPYLSAFANKTITNKDGYSVAYSYNETNTSSHKGTCSLVLNVPLNVGEEAKQIIVSPKSSDATELYTCDYGAYKLIDVGEELKEYHVSFKFTGPYCFDVITDAGSFSFDLMDSDKQRILDEIKNITPQSYSETYKWLDTYLYLMPQDFQDEFNVLKSSVKEVFLKRLSPLSFTIDTYISIQDEAFEKIDAQPLNYFDRDHLLKYFLVYPYFSKYEGKLILNDDNYSMQYIYGRTRNDEGDYVDQLILHIPMVPGGEAEDKVFTVEKTSTNNVSTNAYYLIDANENLAAENVSITYAGSYVVKVTTPAGSYLFDFKSNDDRLLMETLKTINNTNYETIFKNIDARLEFLPSNFVEEYNKLKAPLVYLFTNHVYNATVVDFAEYDRIYHILFDETYLYVDVEDFLQYFLIYPMLGGKEGVTFKCIENSDYSFVFIFDVTNSTTKAGNLTVDYKIPTSPEVLDPEVLRITSSKTLTLNNILFEFFDANSSYSSDNFNVKFRYVSPTSFKAITPVGEFTFSTSNVDGNIEEYCIERLNNINQTNYNNVFTDIETHKDDLSEDFYSEYELVKPGLTTLLSVYGNYSLDENFANTETQVFKSFYIENSFTYVKVENFKKHFSLFPYFSTKNRETYKSKEGFTLTYIFDDPTFSPSTATVEFVIPMEEGADPTNVSIRTTKNYGNIHYSPQGAFYLFDDQSELKEKGISVTFVEPYVFDVTTPAGTFRFDIKNGKENTIYDEIKNITPDTYVEVFNYIDNYSYTLPEDLISEYNGVREEIKSIFSNYKSQDSLYESIIDTHTNLYNYIEENGLKYFDKDQLYKYFSLYPYFSNYVNEKIYSDGEENYILFASNQSLQVDDETINADYFSVFVPLVEGGDPEEVLWHLPHSDSNNTQAHKLIDVDNLFERDDISITFVEPYVVKVTTPAGSFLFDFKANDDLILMRTLNKINNDNYHDIFDAIDNRLEFLPEDFQDEYKVLKELLQSLFNNYFIGTKNLISFKTDINEWEGLYHSLFDEKFKYFDASNCLEYFIIYPYLLDKESVTFECLENPDYMFKFYFDETNSSLHYGDFKLTYAIPVSSDNLNPEMKEIKISRNINYDALLNSIFDLNYFSEYMSSDIKFSYVSPGVFKVVTPAGEFKFSVSNTSGNFESDCVERLENLTSSSDFEYLCYRIINNEDKLSAGFLEEFEYVKPRLEKLFSVYKKTNVLASYADLQEQIYNELFVNKHFSYFNVDSFRKLFLIAPYFTKKAGQTFVSDEGYTLTYSFTVRDSWVDKGDCVAKFHIQMVEGQDPIDLNITPGTIAQSYWFVITQGAGYLFEDQTELKKLGISITFVEPYVFDVTTPAGTFRFYLPA